MCARSLPQLLPHLVSLVEQLARSLEHDFQTEMRRLLPPLLQLLNPSNFDGALPTTSYCPPQAAAHSRSVDWWCAGSGTGVGAEQVLGVLSGYSQHLAESQLEVVPVLVNLFACQEVSVALRIQTIDLLNLIGLQLPLQSFTSQIMHPLMRVLNEGNSELNGAALELLVNMVCSLGPNFRVYLGATLRTLDKSQLSCLPFEDAVHALTVSLPHCITVAVSPSLSHCLNVIVSLSHCLTAYRQTDLKAEMELLVGRSRDWTTATGFWRGRGRRWSICKLQPLRRCQCQQASIK